MDKNYYKILENRIKSIDKNNATIRGLSIKNIESKRNYLNSLMTIIFVAAGFAITIRDSIEPTSLVVSIINYLMSICIAIVYLTFLLTKEGKSLDKTREFHEKRAIKFLNTLESGKLNDQTSFEKYRQEEHKDEKIFNKRTNKDISDIYFLLINILFLIGTIAILVGFLTGQKTQNKPGQEFAPQIYTHRIQKPTIFTTHFFAGRKP